MRIKTLCLFSLLLLTIIILSCKKKDYAKVIEITNPDKLNNVLDQYVKEGLYPFLYARLEDLEGNVIYEHSSINDKLLPDTKIAWGSVDIPDHVFNRRWNFKNR